MPAPKISPAACQQSSVISIQKKTNSGLTPGTDKLPGCWDWDLDWLLRFVLIFEVYLYFTRKSFFSLSACGPSWQKAA